MSKIVTQTKRILEILQDSQWHCVNEFIDLYSIDYRRRLKDLKDKGYTLLNRKCEMHRHIGGSKEWKLWGEPKKEYWWNESQYRHLKQAELSQVLF